MLRSGEKRAKTRAQVISAATSLFAKRAVKSVTVDDIVNEARVAKGTFYVHFDDLNALTVAVADELVRTFDEFLQPQRLSMPDPLMRIAFACNGFFEKALEDPSWAAVVARMAWSFPTVGQVARSRLLEDLKLALKEVPQQDSSLELNLEVVLGIVLQVLAAIGQGDCPPTTGKPRSARSCGRSVRTAGAWGPCWRDCRRSNGPKQRGAKKTQHPQSQA